jgi:hypothetical protein
MMAIKRTGDGICSAIPGRSGGAWEALSTVAAVLTPQIDRKRPEHLPQYPDGNAAAAVTVNTMGTGRRRWRCQRRTIKRSDRTTRGNKVHDSQVEVITICNDAGFSYQ